MKFLPFLAWALVATAAAPPSAMGAAKLPKIVVLSIKPIDEDTAKIAASLTEILTTDLTKTGRFQVMGESEMSSLVGFEQKKQLLGCSESNCLAEIGGALGCDYLLLGAIGKVGSRFSIDLRIADVKKSRVDIRDGALVKEVDGIIEGGRQALSGVVTQLLGPGFVQPPAATSTAEASNGPGAGPYVLMGIGGAALVAGGVLTGVTLATKKDTYYADNELRLGAGFVTAGVGVAALIAGIVWKVAEPAGPAVQTSTTVGFAPIRGGAAVSATGSF